MRFYDFVRFRHVLYDTCFDKETLVRKVSLRTSRETSERNEMCDFISYVFVTFYTIPVSIRRLWYEKSP